MIYSFSGECDSRDGQWGLDLSRLTGWLFRVNHKTQAWSILVSLRCLHYVSSCPGLRQDTFVTTQPPWQLLWGKSSKGPRETGSYCNSLRSHTQSYTLTMMVPDEVKWITYSGNSEVRGDDYGGMCRTEEEEIQIGELVVLGMYPRSPIYHNRRTPPPCFSGHKEVWVCPPELQWGTNEVREEQIDRAGNPDS